MQELLLVLGRTESRWQTAATKAAFYHAAKILSATLEIHHRLLSSAAYVDDIELTKKYVSLSMKMISSFYLCWRVGRRSRSSFGNYAVLGALRTHVVQLWMTRLNS